MWFNPIDEGFVRENFKDPLVSEAVIKVGRTRAMVTTMIVASFVMMMAVALVYALIQQNKASGFQEQANGIMNQVKGCQAESLKQIQLSENAKRLAEETNLKIQRQIQACEKKSNR